MNDTIITTIRAWLSDPKVWVSSMASAFAVGMFAMNVQSGQQDHVLTTAQVLEQLKSHATDMKVLVEKVERVKDENVTQNNILEKILKVNTKTCQNSAKTESGRNSCLDE